MVKARLYEVDVAHHRQTPVVHHMRQRTYLWYVDVDHLPRVVGLARFDPSDHIGDSDRSIRANIDAFLAEHGVHLRGGTITMLTQARTFGYVFNPLTLFWCHDESGVVRCVIAEVHNTYGERHAYLLHPDDSGATEVEKAFYVSPFYPVDGYYRMSVPEPGDRLAITVTLHRPDGRPFATSVRGVVRSASPPSLLRLAVRYPFSTLRVRLSITRHGIALFLKGLPVMARPGAQKSTRTTVAGRLQSLVNEFAGLDLPVGIRAWDASTAGPSTGPTVVLRSRRALRRIVARPGELGLARAYVTGDLDVEGDLTDGLRQVWAAARARPERTGQPSIATKLRALASIGQLGVIGLPPKPPASEAKVTGRLHSRNRDRAVIAHHYDLSNEFYELVLDETMAYSSAYYTQTDQTQTDQPLADAQRAKLDLICRKLALAPGMRLLDVGCGWGSLILHAAEHYGIDATGVTLSQQQRQFVNKRIADRGLADHVRVELVDYRELDLADEYDAVSSIEMGEHVGEANYPVYVRTLHDAVRSGGRLLLQQMSRPAGTAPGGGRFIEAYIAPDMHMRRLHQTMAFLERAGFEISDVEAMRMHYVYTARAWLVNFERNYAAIVALVGEEVARVWRLYLVGGALSFEEGRMGVDQILAVRRG
jgi:cyclopropane fatty-acyl-phospholipid synthase-like methyltransferase/DUF1365 family protein